MKLTCSKIYQDIPFAHRQHHHPGHCQLIHGHNWGIRLTFACSETDSNGFVVDFGGLKFIRSWIEENLDHACVLNKDDPELERLLKDLSGFIKPLIVSNCSAEGLARFFYDTFNPMVLQQTSNRAWIVAVEVLEDSRNSARYEP